MAHGLNKYSARITSPKSQGAPRRCHYHPLRRAHGRARHAGGADAHFGHHGGGTRKGRGPADRQPFFRRIARFYRWPHDARGSGGRADGGQIEALGRRYNFEIPDRRSREAYVAQVAGTSLMIGHFMEEIGKEKIFEIARSGFTAMEK